MKQFGYSVQTDQTIDMDRNDLSLSIELRRREPSIDQCIGCGSCTATCSSGHYTVLNIRMLHTLIRRGETVKIKEEISKCMFCGKCQLACPRGVNLRNLILVIHNLMEERNGKL